MGDALIALPGTFLGTGYVIVGVLLLVTGIIEFSPISPLVIMGGLSYSSSPAGKS
ncbi:hypothetical protein [Aeoliella mucimassa]|uniref:Uncharacterized protein n=1 Tax=Aeoliella mucimassa TaxID=2527972 RepID=A0A518AIL8_9BACT|nr:hypothetical protein [Aeoliella mucimassa]QDU54578.1 hypothetical protein Pan181_07610 [Aeoliella mucimassa]